MTFGYIVLYIWPLAVFAFFRAWPPALALLVTIIGGYLFLPSQLAIEVPGLPALTKDSIPALVAMIAVLALAGRNDKAFQPGWIPGDAIPRILLAGLVLSTVMTGLANRDPLFYGPLVFPALRPWDIFATLLATAMVLLPFFLGRKLLATPEQQKLLLKALVIAGAGYSLLALYEIRMSPQLNVMVYGFFPHAWEQHIRAGGYRPVVFVHHGLWLAIFFAMSILAAVGLAKSTPGQQGKTYLMVGLWLLMTLFLSKSVGALVIALVLLTALLLTSPRGQFLTAAIFAGIALLYPMLRGADLVPVDTILSWAQSISLDRANSLDFRLINEDLLLEKARQRPLFGWGGWGRSFVYDPNTGYGISLIADGYWVGTIGVGGWARYLSEFGLMCLSAILAMLQARRLDLGPETAVLCLALMANVIDLLPNGTATPITWLLAGALWGRLELGRVSETVVEDAPPVERASRYARPAPAAPGAAVPVMRARPKATPPPEPAARPSAAQTRYPRQATPRPRTARKKEGDA